MEHLYRTHQTDYSSPFIWSFDSYDNSFFYNIFLTIFFFYPSLLPHFRWRCKYLICNEKIPRIALKSRWIEIIFKGTISFSSSFFVSIFSSCRQSQSLYFRFFFARKTFVFFFSQWQNEWIHCTETLFDLAAFSNSCHLKWNSCIFYEVLFESVFRHRYQSLHQQ